MKGRTQSKLRCDGLGVGCGCQNQNSANYRRDVPSRHISIRTYAKSCRRAVVVSPVVAVEVCGKYGATGDLEGKAWNDARHGLPVRCYGPGRRDILTKRAQGRGSGPKSLVSLSSVVLLQRTLIWILRALEVDAHAIRQNGQIPGCRAEGRTSTRDSCVLFDGNTPRSRGRADPIDASPWGILEI